MPLWIFMEQIRERHANFWIKLSINQSINGMNANFQRSSVVNQPINRSSWRWTNLFQINQSINRSTKHENAEVLPPTSPRHHPSRLGTGMFFRTVINKAEKARFPLFLSQVRPSPGKTQYSMGTMVKQEEGQKNTCRTEPKSSAKNKTPTSKMITQK